MLRGLIKLAAWAVVTWLLFFVPVEGRSWARHMQEVWELPGVRAKRQLLGREVRGAACRLRGVMPPSISPWHPADEETREGLTGEDRRALDRLLREAQAASPAESQGPARPR